MSCNCFFSARREVRSWLYRQGHFRRWWTRRPSFGSSGVQPERHGGRTGALEVFWTWGAPNHPQIVRNYTVVMFSVFCYCELALQLSETPQPKWWFWKMTMALKQKWEKLSIFELWLVLRLSIRDGSVLVGLRPFISLVRSDPKPKAWSSAAWNSWVVGRVKKMKLKNSCLQMSSDLRTSRKWDKWTLIWVWKSFIIIVPILSSHNWWHTMVYPILRHIHFRKIESPISFTHEIWRLSMCLESDVTLGELSAAGHLHRPWHWWIIGVGQRVSYCTSVRLESGWMRI